MRRSLTWLGLLTTLTLLVAACGGADGGLNVEADFESREETTADFDRARTRIAELARQTCDALLGAAHFDGSPGFLLIGEGPLSGAVAAAEEAGFTGQELALAMGAECPRTMEGCGNCEAIFQDLRRS